MMIKDYCTQCPITVRKDQPVDELFHIMFENSIRHLPVMEGKDVIGILSHRDLQIISHLELARKCSAADIMVPTPYLVNFKTPLDKVISYMIVQKIGSAIVLNDEDELYGIFTVIDALKILNGHIKK